MSWYAAHSRKGMSNSTSSGARGEIEFSLTRNQALKTASIGNSRLALGNDCGIGSTRGRVESATARSDVSGRMMKENTPRLNL